MRETTLLSNKNGHWRRLGSLATLLCLFAMALLSVDAQAQLNYPLGSSGVMGLGSPNGEFVVAQDDLVVKVPGGHVRINRDYDGHEWVFNRQWSGLGDPSFYRSSYGSIGAFYSCTIIDGVSTCDTTASSGQVTGFRMQPIVRGVRVPNDPAFGREADGRPKLRSSIEFVARKGVGFTRSTDGTSYVSSKYPRFLVRPQQVPALPASTGPDAHPVAGRPGHGGVATTPVDGYRWTDRSGQWIEYDQFGRITSYGDRNDVRVWFQYGSHGQIERVLDDNGRTVFTLLYKDGGQFITEARDHTPLDGSIRRVRYFYTDNGYMNRVVDARGGETKFEYGRSTGGGLMGDGDLPDSGNALYSITKVTDAEGRVLKVEYGPTERISKITAPDGGVTEIGYDYDKLKKEFSTTIKYPQVGNDRKVEISRYDAEGRLVYREVGGKTLLTAKTDLRRITYSDASGRTVAFTRDNFDEITSRTNSDGSLVRYVYDSSSLDVKEVVDEAGTSTKMEYDPKGNLVRVRAAAGMAAEQTTEYTINARGEPEVVIAKGGQNPNGGTDPDVQIGLAYDANGNIRELTDGEGNVWRYEFDALGNVTRAIDPLNHEWRYTYDAHGNRLSATDPNGLVTRFEHDATDRLKTITDAHGKIYRFTYDAAGRPSGLIDPTGAASTIEYDAAGRMVREKDASNQQVQYAYDILSRLSSTTDGNGDVTHFDYADVDGIDRGTGLVGKVQYPTYQQLVRYNSERDVTQIVDVVDGESRTTRLDYDIRGALSSVVDAYGKTQSIERDSLGRITGATDELGNDVQIAYDRYGNIARVTNELGHATRYQYDRRGRLVQETNPLGQTTIYVYDAAGRPKEIRRPNGARLAFEFDPGGRLITRRAFRADGSAESVHTFSWDNGNRLVGWQTEAASSVSTYDDANRILGETVSIDGVALARQYTYYPNGQIRTYTGPDGITITYAYDGDGGLASVEIPGEGLLSVTTRAWTEPARILLPGGTVQETERNGVLNPTRFKVKRANQTLAFEQDTRYGLRDEVLEKTTQGRTVEYGYDDSQRLVEANPSSGPTETFQWDAGGNRLSDNVVSGAWHYDDAGRLLQRGTVSYQYDAAGNLLQKTDASLSGPLRTTHYAYDAYNRLIEVRDGAGEVVSRYAYDPFGYRLSKEVTEVGATNTGASQGKRLFLQSSDGLLAEVDAVGTVIQSYGWKPGSYYSTSPLFARNSLGYFYYHNDHLGQPWQVTNKDGAVIWAADRISAFGAVTIAGGSGIDQPWRLPGQYYDAEIGLHYNLHRYYDVATGRYISEDPLGLRGGWNRYAYAHGAPLNFIDPTGEVPLLLIIPLAWGAIELSLTLYDIYNTYTTLTDPCATGAEKFVTVGGTLLGMVAPGGGYSAAGKGVNKLDDVFDDLPVFEVSRNRTPNIADNVEDALAQGKPDILNRVSKEQRDLNREAALEGLSPAGPGLSWDEYPFASCAQGGSGACVRAVPLQENRLQGVDLSAFYRKHGIQPGDAYKVRVVP